ncbi:MAG: hypothetical protein Phog2KO_09210 [Phototrophicaceae bacterium]
MLDYFTEVFPIDGAKIGQLCAYEISVKQGSAESFVDDLLLRLQKAFMGQWVWVGHHIITDNPPSPMQLDITLDILRKEFPALFGSIMAIQEHVNWQPTIEDAAKFMTKACIKKYDSTIREVLRSHGTRVKNAYVMRDYHLQGWEVDGQPALSFTIQSRLLYLQNAQATSEKDIDILNLQVIDKTNAQNIGLITHKIGKVKAQRERLLQTTTSPEMLGFIRDADEKEWVVTVKFDTYSRDYIASALNIILTPNEYEQFSVDALAVEKAMLLKPDVMAKMVSSASDILKQEEIIGKAYNNRENSQHFIHLDYIPEMEFAKKKVRPYKIQTLAQEFVTHGLFSKHARFKDTPIRIAVINALDDAIATDFVEAMRRQMEKDFGLSIEMIKERNVRVVSQKNLASALRAVEKENPHVLLACFSDEQVESYEYLKSLTLGKGIALQAIYEQTMNNPDAMGWVMMGLLAKTGNTPFVLADPFESANLVVGLDWVRQQLTRGDRVVGMSRIYRRDGFFMRYFMDIQDVETDAPAPISLIQSLFPAPIFKGKRVMIHHQGQTPIALVEALYAWGEQLQAEFILVEIHTENQPHIYALQEGISQAPWGSAYLLNPAEAFIVSSSPKIAEMPQSIHIRIRFGELFIENAIYAVLALTLLNYGTSHIPRLPVTIQNADNIAEWLARGMLPNNINNDVPFWL